MLRGAAGKVILSYMEPEDRKKVLNGLEFDEEIFEGVREMGYALSMGEREEGLCGLAAPIIDKNGKLAATISMSGATARFENQLEEKEAEIIRVGKDISARWQSR